MKVSLLLIGLLLPLQVLSQDLERADTADLVGSLSYAELLDHVARSYTDKNDIAQFFYYWVANNITYNYDLADALMATGKIEEQRALEVFETRRAVCSGYAILYKLLLNEFEIECETVHGYAKSKEGIMLSDEVAISHTWNVIKLDNEWQLVDVTWASTMKVEGNVSSFFFKTPPRNFVFNHLPNITYWQLLDQPLTVEEFISLPEINAGYFDLGFDSMMPQLFCDNTLCKLILGKSKEWKPILNLSSTGLDYQTVPYEVKKRGNVQELKFETNQEGTFVIRLDAYKPLDWNSEVVRTDLAYVVVK